MATSTVLRIPLLAATVVVVVACAMLHGGVRAQAPAPTPSGLDCTQSYFNLSNCLSYVMTGSNDTVPDKDCCPELAGLFDSQPICLCELLSGGAESFGISIDNNRALKLPSICHIDSMPVSLCAAIGYPVTGSPMGSPMSPSSAPSGIGPRLPGTPAAPPPQNRAAGAGAGAVGRLALAGLSCAIAVVGFF
ncbi:non-specific lipid transfer protein GPI-anchored 2-like [Musa acuminata AAA Group]|uniref:non-specific lipid transfer protein GPI-anchored 2-like n=1 Tax=Musa acuminata AAA Group TaxID=214697 RepID=UPI0031DA4FC3